MWAKARPRLRLGPRLLNLYALLVAAVLIYPTVQRAIVAVSDDIVFPPRYFSLEAFGELTPSFWAAIPFSVGLGAATTALLVALCLPAAYALERMQFRGRHAVGALIFLPFIIPGVGYMVALGTIYLLLIPQLLGSFLGVLIPTAMFNLAWMVRALQGSLATADPVYEEAAQTLGASRLRAFLTITLPQMAPGIAVGAMIVFANSSTAFIAPLFVGRVQAITATVEIFRELDQHGLVPRLAVQALLVELVVMSLIGGAYLLTRRRFKGLVL